MSMQYRDDDADEVDELNLTSRTSSTPPRPCDCGSPNCNSRVCLKINSLNESPIPAFKDSSTVSFDSLSSGYVRTVSEEEVSEEKDLVKPKPPPPPPSPSTLESSTEEDEEIVVIPVPSPPEPAKEVVETPHSALPRDSTAGYIDPDWNRGCFCSLRDSKDHLLRRYIKHFTETMQYSKHLQKLEFGGKCNGQSRNAQVTCGCTSADVRSYSAAKRTPAVSRVVDRSPFEFLNRTYRLETCAKMAKPALKTNNDYIIINCPKYKKLQEEESSDDDIEDELDVPMDQPSKCRAGCTIDNGCVCKKLRSSLNKRPLITRTSLSQVTFGNDIDGLRKLKLKMKQKKLRQKQSKCSEMRRSMEAKLKIEKRKVTPYSSMTSATTATTVGTQKHLLDDTTDDFEVYDDDADSVESVKDYMLPCSQDACVQKSILQEQQTETEPSRIDCINCGCSTSEEPMIKPTFTKTLNDRSKEFAEKFCGSSSNSMQGLKTKAGLTRVCLRKILNEPPRMDRSKIMQEQKDLCRSYQRQMSLSGGGKSKSPDNQRSVSRSYPEKTETSTMEPELATDTTIQCTKEYYVCPDELYLSSQTEIDRVPSGCFKFYPGGGRCSPHVQLEDGDSDVPDDCTCGNYCAPECKEPCSKPCSFATQKNTIAYCAGCCKHQNPYSERCQGPRYCMNLQTPFKSFYPATAVQVNSMELVQKGRGSAGGANGGRGGRSSVLRRTTDLDTKQLKQYIKDAIEIQMEDVMRDLQELMGSPGKESPNLHMSPVSKESRQMKFNIPFPSENVTNTKTFANVHNSLNLSQHSSEEEEEEEEEDEEEEVVPEKTKFRSSSVTRRLPTHSPSVVVAAPPNPSTAGSASVPPPSTADPNSLMPSKLPRESKRVSMKYEFPLYNADDTVSAQPGKPSATDSIEERIRILRQNLEQRRDFDSETPSSRSQTTIMSLKDRQVSMNDDSDTTQTSAPRNKINSSGRIMKKL